MIVSNDNAEYHCLDCGHMWQARDRYLWWPIRLAWAPRAGLHSGAKFFARWGWQVGWDGIEQRIFGHTVRIGPLLIKFGKDMPDKKHPRDPAATGAAK